MQRALYILSFVLFVNTAVLAAQGSFFLGLGILFLLAVCLFLLARYWSRRKKLSRAGRGYAVKQCITAALIFLCFMAGYIMIFACIPPESGADAVIVPGSGVNSDGTPSAAAQDRLDGCIEYCRSNNVKAVVVSGTAGKKSAVSEAQSMKKYLTDHGIDPGIILCDENAANTRQNFENAFRLLKDEGISTQNVVYVTNSFHCLRAGICARQAGFENISACATGTDIWVFLPAMLREICAVCAVLFLGY